MSKTIHPTKERLIETVAEMLDGEHPQEIHVDDVLAVSGISKGSLYHHFEDFPDLIEATLVHRFAAGVDETTRAMTHILTTATGSEDFWDKMYDVTVASQDPARAHFRAERARIIGLAASSDRFRDSIASEQDRLTDAMGELILDAQHKRWVRDDVDPRAIAVFLQAYTLGRAVDDIASNHIDPNEWNRLISIVTDPFRA